MRLKRLETFGFKSFADRMTFDFEDGITAVIGPNGCGKSNIVDSIKWVIGEQSAKALRGEDMTDVIFNGCATRRGMAFAEVTLVLDQVGVQLGLQNDEVAITRRLSRDGNSQYFLNGKPCRLKDIKELFMDTGVGTAAYSVIEQGRVGFILESNTKDRRIILEEAAGISRYKARRKVALRKLERVELDIQRIGEVLNEVRRRVKAVTRQAQAALRFKELTEQVRELRMAFALEEFGRLNSELTEHNARVDVLVNSGAEVAARLGELEAALATADLRLIDLENSIRSDEQQRADAQSRRDVADSRAKDAKYRLVELDQQEVDDKNALAQLTIKIETLSKEHELAEQSLRNVETDSSGNSGDETLNAALKNKRDELDAAIAAVDTLVADIEDAKAKQVEALREISRIEAEHSRVNSARHASEERRKRLEDRTGGQTDALMHARATEAQAQSHLGGLIANAAALHTSLDDVIRQREVAIADGSRLDNELNEIRHQKARADTGMRMLEEQDKRAEGVFRGVKDVLQEMHKFPGVVGMVADLCRVPDDYVTAIETALGSQAQNIVTETQEAARNAIQFLKQERRGRATFLPLNDIRGDERVDQRLLRERGVVGVASRLIEYDDSYRNAFEHLLGNVLIVESLDDAIQLRRNQRVGCRLVTLDGEVVNAGGAMTGGKQQGADNGGLVSRKNEIHRLKEQVTELSEREQNTATQRDQVKKLAFELSLRTEEIRRAIKQLDANVGEAKAEVMKNERDRLHLEDATSSYGAELQEISAEIQKIDSEARDLSGQREWFTALNKKLENDIAAMQGDLDNRAARRNQAQEDVNNLRVSVATTHERQEAVRNNVMHLVRSLQELEDNKAERERRLANLDHKRAELRTIAEENQLIFTNEAQTVIVLAEKLALLIKERDGLRNGVEEQRQEARALASRQRAVESEKNQLDIKISEAKVRSESLSQRILDDYQLDLAEAFSHYQRPENLDWPKLRHDLAQTEKELAAIGPVNLAAIDELEEVQARETFLDQQFKDLTHAQEKLKEIIEQINDISRKLFEQTYRDVRRNFQELFRKLFGGGKADLVLEKPEPTEEITPDGQVIKKKAEPLDILEAGLEIVAQPPGKNPKIITQLSGGEKALTAIALLFAVYQTKPSPFCILDEVDAPLDEANVDVYCNMLREFVKDSQFIVITHKKRTMQRVDAIYGITQNEPGVSTKISVKFEDVGKLGDTENTGELLPTVRGAGPYAG
jgi:chromosome segregation protein